MKVHEIFYSIQGEGTFTGSPTIFLRTTGCNLRCSFCDTTYAYTKGKELVVDEILSELKKYPCTSVCITGGEPLLQKDLSILIDALLQRKFLLCLETNGSLDIKKYSGKKRLILSLDIKCPSSHMTDYMHFKNISYLQKKDQLKFIIKNLKDYEYSKEILMKYKPRCLVFFQPVWGTNPQKLASWILKDTLPVRMGLQLHKIIWGTKKRV